ncbi:hypothetical protein BN2537_9199 [Streptomyces venezuelae]|nr:hypothetical protein BN2537_9199 [Streptomyces venezuelae]
MKEHHDDMDQRGHQTQDHGRVQPRSQCADPHGPSVRRGRSVVFWWQGGRIGTGLLKFLHGR